MPSVFLAVFSRGNFAFVAVVLSSLVTFSSRESPKSGYFFRYLVRTFIPPRRKGWAGGLIAPGPPFLFVLYGRITFVV